MLNGRTQRRVLPRLNLNKHIFFLQKVNFIRVHPLNGIEKMEEALATTKLIDWNRPVNVVFASSEVDECFKRLGVRFGLKIQGTKACKHVLHRESALLEDIW